MTISDEQHSQGLRSMLSQLPLDQLKTDFTDMAKTMGEHALDSATQRVTGATDRLNEAADNGGVLTRATQEGGKAAIEGGSPVAGALKGSLGGLKDKAKQMLPGGGGGGDTGKATKSTNIVETIDVGVPIDVAYNQWTQYEDFTGFMKKVERVKHEEDNTVSWKAQVFWSHRTWKATVIDQVPNERIVWRSEGEKGRVDGTVTFHELAPNLTRILVVLEYYPQGFMERTGNIWRAQGRRARLEIKHFRRHVMTRTILEPDELEGWRGEIHDGEVVRDHDEVVEEERGRREESEGHDPEDEYDEASDQPEDEYEEYDEEPRDEAGDEPEDEYEEYDEAPRDEAGEEPEGEYVEEEQEDELEEQPLDEEEDDDDEEPEPEERPRRGSRSRSRSTTRGR